MRAFNSKLLYLAIITLTAPLITACSATQQYHYKTGQLVQSITCEGGSWSRCYVKAGETCQTKGYDVIEKNSYKSSGFFSSYDTKELIYACKN